jgi:hypothetical protein
MRYPGEEKRGESLPVLRKLSAESLAELRPILTDHNLILFSLSLLSPPFSPCHNNKSLTWASYLQLIFAS